MAETRKINPQCLLTTKSLAITNEGIVLPCCECDSPHRYSRSATPGFMNLLKTSNIDDFDSIEDVISQPSWKRFQEDLLNDQAPEWCYEICDIKKEDRNEHNCTLYTFNNGESIVFKAGTLTEEDEENEI